MNDVATTTGVLHIRSQFFVDGGAETFLNALISHLRADSFRHHVALLLSPGIDRPCFCDHLLDAPGISLERTRIAWRRSAIRQIVDEVGRILDDGPYQVVHTHDFRASLVAACLRLRRRHRFRWVASAHGWFVKPFKVWLHGELEKILVRFADRIHLASERLYGWMRVPPRRRLVAIPYFLDPAVFSGDYDAARLRAEWGIPDECPLLGFVARLTPEKGHISLLRAMALVAERGIGFRLAVVGTGPMRPKLEALVQTLGLADRVIFTGYFPDAIEACNAFDLLVHPSLGETMAPALLEALCLGKPLVATDVGAHRDLVHHGKNGLVVPPGRPKALADAVAHMLAAPANLHRAAQESRHIRDSFLPPRVAPRYARLYQSLAPGTRALSTPTDSPVPGSC